MSTRLGNITRLWRIRKGPGSLHKVTNSDTRGTGR